MNNDTTQKTYRQRELDELIPDYLNGHASTEEVAAIEARLSADEEFRAHVEHERQLFRAVRTPTSGGVAQPDFSQLADRLHVPRAPRWFGLTGGAVAACALVMVFGLDQWMSDDASSFNDFETLSSAPVEAPARTLRVIGDTGVSDEDFRAAFAAMDLTVTQQFPSLHVYDVEYSPGADEDSIVRALQSNRYVRSVRVLSGESE